MTTKQNTEMKKCIEEMERATKALDSKLASAAENLRELADLMRRRIR